MARILAILALPFAGFVAGTVFGAAVRHIIGKLLGSASSKVNG